MRSFKILIYAGGEETSISEGRRRGYNLDEIYLLILQNFFFFFCWVGRKEGPKVRRRHFEARRTV